jgi:hypothetical protein
MTEGIWANLIQYQLTLTIAVWVFPNIRVETFVQNNLGKAKYGTFQIVVSHKG